MNKEQVFFLQIIEDYIKRQKTEIIEGINWTIIFQYAKKHGLEGIVYYQCEYYFKLISELNDIRRRFNEAYVMTLYRYASLKHAYEEIRTLYQDNNIKFVMLKGLEVASAYSVPALRTMCDLDILVLSEYREKAKCIMESMGYTVKKGAYEWHCYKNNISIEIHDCLIYNDSSEARSLFFKNVWNHCFYLEEGTLAIEHNYHLVFLLEHLKKHFMTHGVGFRQFMDIVFFVKNNNELDWNWIIESLKQLGIFDFAQNVFYMCNQWWHVSLPDVFKDTVRDDSFFRDSTELVFKNGMFGFQNNEHMGNAFSESLSQIKAPCFLKPMIRSFMEICKPYSIMSRYPYCSFLVGRKYLLPIAWIKRLSYLLSHKRDESLEVIKSIKNIEQLSRHSDFKKKWGI